MMKGYSHHFSLLYKAFVHTPELSKFRRYTDYWSWILYNEISAIDKQIHECNDIFAAIQGHPQERGVFTITDYHHAYDDGEHPMLHIKVESLKESMRRYSKDLVLAHAIANLPDQCDIYARHFAEYQEVFEGGMFGPTKGDAEIYQQVPAHNDTCSLKTLDQQDYFSNFVLRHLKSINVRVRAIYRVVRKQTEPDLEAAHQQHVALDHVRLIINLLAAFYVPVLFSGSLGILSCLSSEKARIVVLGVFGIVLVVSLIVCVPSLRRSDIFAITAAFFAVGGVYIGARSADR